MKNFKEEFFKMLSLTQEGTPFALTRFSDGEVTVLKNEKLVLAENYFIQGDVYFSALEEDKVFLTNVWKHSSQKYLGINSTHAKERLPQEYRQLWVVMPPADEVRSRKTVNWTREDAGKKLSMRTIILDPITPEFSCHEDMLVKVSSRLRECSDGLESVGDVTLSSVTPVARADRFFF